MGNYYSIYKNKISSDQTIQNNDETLSNEKYVFVITKDGHITSYTDTMNEAINYLRKSVSKKLIESFDSNQYAHTEELNNKPDKYSIIIYSLNLNTLFKYPVVKHKYEITKTYRIK